MGVEVKQGRNEGPIEGPKVVAASEVGPTTYAEGGVVRQETWEEYQPEVAKELKSAAARAEASQAGQVAEVAPRADGGHPFADRGVPSAPNAAATTSDAQGSTVTDGNPVGSTTKSAAKKTGRAAKSKK